ncbi:hypothetical protein [Solemya velesiana gill symbiont]|uniref:Lytic murein transglycosylase n=1 Tax=Solemya velesiana gill symbiont TaxID=1918948 RepID=A0A1T2KTJ2_9GAMM|nr:hypothetical protein [Solemya velesiana gill symbiont]OOZ36036.1 hypothetical protein BOW51_09115 [Solemya velesiana gill symbiont]
MDRKIVLGILSLSLIALAIAILIPSGRVPDSKPTLPWQIQIDGRGLPTVFDLTLGESTLSSAQGIFKETGDISLFATPDDHLSAEAFFERLYINGIRASMILTLDLDQGTLSDMFDRGVRLQKLETGNRKISLAGEDYDRLATARINHITYVPAANLDGELIKGRFGEPVRRIMEPETGAEHWLYPEKGLDIALNPDEKEVFQYVIPAEFDRILEPLEAAAEKSTPENQ